MATIYLSSTYENLKDFRSAVVRALRQSEYRVIAMEDYVATDQRPVDKCLKDVEKADIYVGLFAFRYGYIPPSEQSNQNGLSITELELRHAQLLKKPCLTFFADQKAAGFPPTMMDAFTGDGEAGKHIKRLRDELGREQTASFFSAPYQLASLVQASVASYLTAHSPPASSSTPQAPDPAVITWDIEKNGSPYPGLMHFTRKYAPVFFGREAEIHDVLDRLRSPEGRFLIISGASGTGKSSLVDAGVLPKIETTVANEGPGYHSARMVPSRGRHPFDALMRPLHGYAEQAGVDAYTVSEQLLSQPNHLPQIFGEITSKCFKNAELVLFLDQMEELFTGQDRAQSHSFLSALYRTTQDAPLRIIATIRSDFLHHCHEQPDLLRMLNGQGHIGIGPIDAGSVREMILRPAQCAGLSLSEKLVRRVTDEAGHELGNLPLLAFALWQLFDKLRFPPLFGQVFI